jgi:hypothetical protein
MSDLPQPSREEVRAAARLTELELPDDRLDQLVRTFTAYLANLERLRALSPGASEPPAITYESEARR